MNGKPYVYHIIAAVLVLFALLVMRAGFPELVKYHYGADEGYYLHYANTLHEEGFYKGMHRLADEHAEKVQRYTLPSPLRVFHMFCIWLFSYLIPGITGLSWLSLLSYLGVMVVSYVFVYRHYGGVSAIIATALLATAPLALGVSNRALMDATNYLLIIGTATAFIRYLKVPSWGNLALFVAVQTFCILEKEINAMLLPAFALVWLFYFFRRKGAYPFVHGLVVAAVVPLACLFTYVVFFGWDNFMATFTALGKAYEVSPFTSYGLIYHTGPWYQFVADYAVLAPVMLLASLLGLGYLLAKDTDFDKSPIITLGLIFLSNVIFIVTVSMNVRYVIYMEWYMVLILAVVIPLWVQRIPLEPLKRVVGIAVVVGLMVFNFTQYHRIFVAHTTYDTINYNLWVASEVSPRMEMDAVVDAERVKLTSVPLDGASQALLKQAYELYGQKDYEGVVRNCKAIIKVHPYHAETYNVLCSAYNDLGKYHYAIEACNLALVMAPEFQLAKNNLAWAYSQLEAQQ